MFRLILVCCLLRGGLSEEYGLPTGTSSGAYNQPQNEGQIQNQAQIGGQIQSQDDQGNVILQSPPQGAVSGSGGPEQPYPAQAIEGIQQQELPYEGPSDIQQEQQVFQQPSQQQQGVFQQAEAPQQPAETYGLPPASGQGADVSLDHPPGEQPQQVYQITGPQSPPAQPAEVYGLPPEAQSLSGPKKQTYVTGASYLQKYPLSPSSQYQQGKYRQGTQYQSYAQLPKPANQYPNQYQTYLSQYRQNEPYQKASAYRGQYQQSLTQYRPSDQYQKNSQYQNYASQYRQGIKYPTQYQIYNQNRQIGQYQKNQQQQQDYRGSNVYSPPQSSYANQNYNQNPQYASQYRQGSQVYQTPNQYQPADQRRKQPTQNRYQQPSVYRQQQQQQQQQQEPYPAAQSSYRVSSQFESSNYISNREPNVNATPGRSGSTHSSQGYQDAQTSQMPVRYILIFQRNQAEGAPEKSSVSYLSHPIPQRQLPKFQDVASLPKLVETDEFPIVLPVPPDFPRGSSYGSASSTFVSKDSPGDDQQQNRPYSSSNDGERQVNPADVSSQFVPSRPDTAYGLRDN